MPDLADVVSRHLQKRWSQIRCVVCGENDWTMNGPFALVPALVDTQGRVNGYRSIDTGSPVVALVCRSCAHTVLLDYNVIIGLEP